MHIPIIDFSVFLDSTSSDDAKFEIAKNLDQACREVGFFYLSGHGIDSSLFSEMLSNAKHFFVTASSEEKDQIKVRPSGEGTGDDSRGYRVVERADAGYEVSLGNEQEYRSVLIMFFFIGRRFPSRARNRWTTIHERPRPQPVAQNPSIASYNR